jgi:hypothetical protein
VVPLLRTGAVFSVCFRVATCVVSDIFSMFVAFSMPVIFCSFTACCLRMGVLYLTYVFGK